MLKMYAELDGKLNGMDFEEYRNAGNGLRFGGFCFRLMIDGEDRSVNFDWDSYIANVQEDGTLLLEEGTQTWLGGSEELDDVYDEEYKNEGFARGDLTAKFLASTTEIEEFVMDYDVDDCKASDDYLHIRSITFVDETGSYTVAGDVLDKFNEMLPYESIKAEGDLGSYDEFDGLYPGESDLSYSTNSSVQQEYEDYEEDLPF